MSRPITHLVSIFAAATLFACGPSGTTDEPGGADAGFPTLPDEDGDGIADQHEGRSTGVDTDSDGIPDYLDEDSDNDGIPDYREAGDDQTGTPPIDSDSDGIPNFQDTDSDGNGRPDGVDGVDDPDLDGLGNFMDTDDDGDGIPDEVEIGPSPAMPVDTDGDTIPDFQDLDSDSDGIWDRHEGIVDGDMDGVPAYQDMDSDGDCILDGLEAGDNDMSTPPVDSDGDLAPDFLDLDSDNDGLLDGLEDPNCNGFADPQESDPTNADTDGDGVSDLVENAAGTDPTNPSDNPQANGDFVFVVPYMNNPMPATDTLDFSTSISQADVVFSMDTTGSMGQEIGALKSSVVSLINTIRGDIPNTGFGVVGYEDFPYGNYGVSGDQPFYLLHRVMTTNTAAGLQSVQNRVNAYNLGNGNDSPESGWEMLYQLATGAGTTQGNASVPNFNSGKYPANALAGEQVGTIGGAGFRSGSLPIAIWMTDACNHNSSIGYGYSGFSAATRTSAMSALNANSIKVISVVSSPQVGGCGADDARVDARFAAENTGAVVPPSAWGTSRPSGCSASQCCTGINGVGESPIAGNCPLIFRVNGSNGAGLSNAVATAVKVLTSFVELDVGAIGTDDPSDSVDALAAFVERIETNTTAGGTCATGYAVTDTNSDSVNDTFRQVLPGNTVCFDVVAKQNTTVPPLTTPQMFKATVRVEGDGVTVLDTRDVYFLVPPEIPDIPID